MNVFSKTGPIVIGGVGGSGTRLIASLLKDLGFFIGNELNKAYDNLFFTLLFKRPKWFDKVFKNSENEIYKGLTILENRMTSQERLRTDQIEFIKKAAQNYIHGQDLANPIQKSILSPQPIHYASYKGWGWKEPNSHIYLEYLDKYFADLKYIHVIRHGLNMAYSKNQQQLHNWGHLFDISIPDELKKLPKASLQYWIQSNEKVLQYGKQKLGDRFLLMNIDEFCLDPIPQIRKLEKFLGVVIKNAELHTANINSSITLPKYKYKDLSIFDEKEFNAVKAFGYTID